jgi:hypothetical protein
MAQPTQSVDDLDSLVSASVSRVREALIQRPWAAREAKAALQRTVRIEEEARKQGPTSHVTVGHRPRFTVIDGGKR